MKWRRQVHDHVTTLNALNLSAQSVVRAISYVLVLITYTHQGVIAQEQPKPRATAHHILGRCHDYGTALGLKATVYAVTNQSRQKLAECKETGYFDVLLPVSATHLALEMSGYRPITIPVHFTDNIAQNARFSISNLGAMAKLDSLPISPSKDSYLALYFNVIDSIDVIEYALTGPVEPSIKLRGPIFLKRGTTITFSVAPDDYIATVLTSNGRLGTVSTSDGRLISSEKMTLKPGITFKAVRVVKPPTVASLNKVRGDSSSTMLSPTVTVLYFDQSSHQLRPQIKVTLDSIARLLVGKSKLMVTVTGYTDNVGKRDLNTALSEYRARAVEKYLKQHGVQANQIVASWKGPDTKSSPEDAEVIKAKTRRVVIEFIPQ